MPTATYSARHSLADEQCRHGIQIAKTAAGYSSTPITLVNFDATNGYFPTGGLIADANGNLFGTTFGGAGTVFEIVKSAAGYSSIPFTLANFNNANGC